MDACLRSKEGPAGRRAGGLSRGLPAGLGAAVLLALSVAGPRVSAAADRVAGPFGEQVQPILEEYCYACHGNGVKKGGQALDGPASDAAWLRDRDLWWAVLRNVRAGLMPPAGEPRPTEKERQVLEDWIKYG